MSAPDTIVTAQNCSREQLIEKIVAWLETISITTLSQPLVGDEFLLGVTIEEGKVIFDPEKLQWPGDLLHEAGHVAICPPSRRASLGGKLQVTPAEEMSALAWSYAAAVAAGIDPLIVFHEGGYQGNGAQLAAQYASGLPPGGPGVPMLQWFGMTTKYPQMNHWLRETEDPA